MVQRDYVRKKKRQTKKNKSQSFSGLMIFLAIIIIALFSAILYFVSNNHPNKPVEPPKVKTEPPAITLPEKPQERWTYLKELETPNANPGTNAIASERQQILDSFVNNSRNVPTTSSQPKPPTTSSQSATDSKDANKWLLQCGAFKEKANADTLKAQLAMIGISGNIASGQLYRVTVGPYTSKSNAEKALNSLKVNGINNCIISN